MILSINSLSRSCREDGVSVDITKWIGNESISGYFPKDIASAMKFWLDEGWLSDGDLVYWDGIDYGVPSPEVYQLSVSLTGLDAVRDNEDNPVIDRPLHRYAPMSEGCCERYLTSDGILVDMDVDSVDLGEFLGVKLNEVTE